MTNSHTLQKIPSNREMLQDTQQIIFVRMSCEFIQLSFTGVIRIFFFLLVELARFLFVYLHRISKDFAVYGERKEDNVVIKMLTFSRILSFFTMIFCVNAINAMIFSVNAIIFDSY